MGYPVEQQKYQSLGNLVLTFPAEGDGTDYRHELDLDTAVDDDELSSRAASAIDARSSSSPSTRSSSSG